MNPLNHTCKSLLCISPLGFCSYCFIQTRNFLASPTATLTLHWPSPCHLKKSLIKLTFVCNKNNYVPPWLWFIYWYLYLFTCVYEHTHVHHSMYAEVPGQFLVSVLSSNFQISFWGRLSCYFCCDTAYSRLDGLGSAGWFFCLHLPAHCRNARITDSQYCTQQLM